MLDLTVFWENIACENFAQISTLFCPNLPEIFENKSENIQNKSSEKSVNFIINYAQDSLNHRVRKILIGDKRSECMFAWVQRAGLIGDKQSECMFAWVQRAGSLSGGCKGAVPLCVRKFCIW